MNAACTPCRWISSADTGRTLMKMARCTDPGYISLRDEDTGIPMNPLSLPRPEAVIFDFDGILVDTEPMHYEAFREAFRAKGTGIDAVNLAELVVEKSRAFHDGLRNGVSPYPGAVPMIESLHADGLPLALCSGALRSDIDPILARLGVARCFPVIVAADDVRKSKPDPESYGLAFRKLSETYPSRMTIPEASIAVEDTPAGIRSAKGAGLRVLAVTNSYGAGELSGADWITDSLENVRIDG